MEGNKGQLGHQTYLLGFLPFILVIMTVIHRVAKDILDVILGACVHCLLYFTLPRSVWQCCVAGTNLGILSEPWFSGL